ncbi:2-succinyl-5-enolpyruvyl-6-hydroxy-3-cyclohexene-1-carboxylic-acid synthase [Cellulosimicrobium marinum]|uniref:2-succinyl-5-enolpyruvyl-6-hydroxy-3- cyclohexene-1-carboxylic-acid synthase n=1 Tax=Cellulosimicrobium marinum TaxID=1638992 RepID=UPI001E2D0718|nr:2-succinyl-5-enolpyruvyl-6-hydroxy-3-cyclohexene-1-carboxylic-acid synthase [Cellulosimicrobium marinum]MCB7138178.1 2-succinyl-5-enolpyruvyl-6-hydroxy-3-cyclohexene-1-carboxylic-acid synthase [Cellulosimicrobium marinum]
MSGSAPDAGPAAEAPSVECARALVAALVAAGVRDVVLAPGSRSAPLAYAVAAAADAGLLALHVRVDERSAAFCALGLSRGAAPLDGPGGTRLPRPVAVVTTSGTAVANLHPAVLEAHHAGVPLVLLTADRPHELRGTGANQTTDQVGLFAGAVRLVVDHPAPDGRPGEAADLVAATTRALAAATGARDGRPGPVHVNLAFRDPLVPAEPDAAAPVPAALAPAPDGRMAGTEAGTVAGTVAGTPGAPVVVPPVVRAPDVPAPPGRTLLVAGDRAGDVARGLAAARGWPLLAEPSSGAAGGPHHVVAHPLVLGARGLADDVEHVVVLGRATLSRPVQRLLARPDVDVTVVAPGGGPWPDAARNATTVLPAVPDAWLRPGAPHDVAFLARWQAASRAAADVVDAATTGQGDPDGPAVARAVVESCGPDDVLVVGASSPVRDLGLVLGLLDAAPADLPTVVANRGLAGIDGTVSTALGVALATPGRRVRALLGDLTFLHDVGGLLRGPDEPPVDLRLVVVNDDGGSIFAGLEPGGLGERSAAATRTFERVFATPHGADLALLCAGYGVRHTLVPDVAALRRALDAPARGVEVVEARVDRSGRRAAGVALADAVRAAVEDATVR